MKKLNNQKMKSVVGGSLEFADGSNPDLAGAFPVGGQGGDYEQSFGPNSAILIPLIGDDTPWTSHRSSPVLDFGENL